MSISIDASSNAGGDSGTTLVSSYSGVAISSPPGNALAVLTCVATSTTAYQPVVSGVTDDQSTHFNWTNVMTVNQEHGSSSIWIADVPATPPSSFQPTISFTTSSIYPSNSGLAIFILVGARSVAGQIGQIAGTYGTSATPSANLTALAGASSFLVATTIDTSGADSPSFSGGQTDIVNGGAWAYTGATSVAGWAQYVIGGTAGSSTNMTVTSPTSANYSMAAVEILANVPNTATTSFFV